MRRGEVCRREIFDHDYYSFFRYLPPFVGLSLVDICYIVLLRKDVFRYSESYVYYVYIPVHTLCVTDMIKCTGFFVRMSCWACQRIAIASHPLTS